MANVVCLLSYDAYGTVLTGNTISCVRCLVNAHWEDFLFYLCVIISYWSGAFLAQLAHRQGKWRASALAGPVFGLFGLHELTRWLTDMNSRYTIMFFSLALGIVNTATSTLDGVVTQMITGHWTKVAGQAAELFVVKCTRTKKTLAVKDKVELALSGGVIICFVSGIATAQALFRYAIDGELFPAGSFALFGVAYAIILYEHDIHERVVFAAAAKTIAAKVNKQRRFLERRSKSGLPGSRHDRSRSPKPSTSSGSNSVSPAVMRWLPSVDSACCSCSVRS